MRRRVPAEQVLTGPSVGCFYLAKEPLGLGLEVLHADPVARREDAGRKNPDVTVVAGVSWPAACPAPAARPGTPASEVAPA